MTNSVERPAVHVLAEDQPSEGDVLRPLEPQVCTESAESDQRLRVLWSYVADRSTFSQLKRYAFKYTRNLKDAEDCVSEAIARTATHIGNLEHASKPVIIKYLLTTIRNLAFDICRQRRNARRLHTIEGGLKVPNENDFYRHSSPDLHHGARFDVEDRRVWLIFMELPPATRRVALLRFLLEYDIEMIADKLQIKKRPFTSTFNWPGRHFNRLSRGKEVRMNRTEHSSPSDVNPLRDEATAWLIRLHSAHPTRKVWAEFEAWLLGDPRRQSVYYEVEQEWPDRRERLKCELGVNDDGNSADDCGIGEPFSSTRAAADDPKRTLILVNGRRLGCNAQSYDRIISAAGGTQPACLSEPVLLSFSEVAADRSLPPVARAQVSERAPLRAEIGSPFEVYLRIISESFKSLARERSDVRRAVLGCGISSAIRAAPGDFRGGTSELLSLLGCHHCSPTQLDFISELRQMLGEPKRPRDVPLPWMTFQAKSMCPQDDVMGWYACLKVLEGVSQVAAIKAIQVAAATDTRALKDGVLGHETLPFVPSPVDYNLQLGCTGFPWDREIAVNRGVSKRPALSFQKAVKTLVLCESIIEAKSDKSVYDFMLIEHAASYINALPPSLFQKFLRDDASSYPLVKYTGQTDLQVFHNMAEGLTVTHTLAMRTFCFINSLGAGLVDPPSFHYDPFVSFVSHPPTLRTSSLKKVSFRRLSLATEETGGAAHEVADGSASCDDGERWRLTVLEGPDALQTRLDDIKTRVIQFGERSVSIRGVTTFAIPGKPIS